MLHLTISDKNAPKITKYVPPTSSPQSPPYTYTAVSTIFTQAVQRDNIIKKAAKECPFSVGQYVVPITNEGMEKYGECKILYICQSYSDYGRDVDWPDSNNPLIISAWSDKLGGTMFASWNYFKVQV